jgi:hypothetical protein
MKENFSIQRIQALLLRFWAEKKNYIFVLAGIMVLVFSAFNYSMPNIDMTRAYEKVAIMSMFVKYLLLIVLIFHLHLAFAKGSGSAKSRLMHLLPASAIEKFVYLLLVGFILPLISYIALFQLVNVIFVAINLSTLFPFHQLLFPEFTLIAKQAGFEALSVTIKLFTLLVYYFTLQLLILGLIVFKEYAVLKVFAFMYLSSNMFSFVATLFFNVKHTTQLMNSLQQYSIENPNGLLQLSWILFVVLFTLLSTILFVSYLKFKTKEIKV